MCRALWAATLPTVPLKEAAMGVISEVIVGRVVTGDEPWATLDLGGNADGVGLREGATR